MKVDEMSNKVAALKTKLAADKAVHDRDVEAAKQATAHLQLLIDELTEDMITDLEDNGYYVRFIKDIQLDELSKNQQYLDSIKGQLDDICTKLYNTLMEEINA